MLSFITLVSTALAGDPPSLTAGEFSFAPNADTLEPGAVCIHPLFLDSSIGIARGVELKMPLAGLVAGPAFAVEAKFYDGPLWKASIEPSVASDWRFDDLSAGATLHVTRRVAGDDRVNLSVGGIYDQADEARARVPIALGYDLVQSERTVYNFVLSADPTAEDPEIAGLVDWTHGGKSFRISLGALVLVNPPGGALPPGAQDLDLPTVLPLPHVALWWRDLAMELVPSPHLWLDRRAQGHLAVSSVLVVGAILFALSTPLAEAKFSSLALALAVLVAGAAEATMVLVVGRRIARRARTWQAEGEALGLIPSSDDPWTLTGEIDGNAVRVSTDDPLAALHVPRTASRMMWVLAMHVPPLAVLCTAILRGDAASKLELRHVWKVTLPMPVPFRLASAGRAGACTGDDAFDERFAVSSAEPATPAYLDRATRQLLFGAIEVCDELTIAGAELTLRSKEDASVRACLALLRALVQALPRDVVRAAELSLADDAGLRRIPG